MVVIIGPLLVTGFVKIMRNRHVFDSLGAIGNELSSQLKPRES